MISIVTPTLNCGPKLRRTLTALRMQAVPFEHIVQDGGSTDETLAIARSAQHRPVVVSESDSGLYDAISRGFGHASGDVLGWINAGDVYAPWALGVVEAIFRAYPQVLWITGIPATFVEDPGAVWAVPYAPVYPRRLIAGGWYRAQRLGYLQQETMFWRRELWEKADAVNVLSRHRYAADFQLWKVFAQHATLYTTPTVLGCFGYERGQISERFRDKYIQESGSRGRDMTAHRFARIANRAISTVLRRRLLRPVVGDGAWEFRQPKWL